MLFFLNSKSIYSNNLISLDNRYDIQILALDAPQETVGIYLISNK